MKKWLLVLFIVFYTSSLYAIEINGPQFLSTTITNEATAGGAYKATVVSTTNIYPGRDQILGYTVIPLANTASNPTECVASLYDQSTTTITSASGECLGEAESPIRDISTTIWFPYPQSVTNAVLVWQGPNTAVTIYYRR